MIASVSGTIQHITAESVVVEVCGVGIAVQCGPGIVRAHQVGEHVVLATSLVVREDSLTLYGFPDADHRDVFQTLQSVSGVGPRLALGVLSVLTPDQLRLAVHNSDEATLTKVPGIGRKGAARLVLELSDKLPPSLSGAVIDIRTGAPAPEASSTWQAPVREGLLSLGWSAREADEAIAVVVAERELLMATQSPADSEPTDPEAEVSRMLAQALRGMARHAKGGGQ